MPRVRLLYSRSAVPIGEVDPAGLTELYRFPDGDAPWVRTNFVSTLDGSIQGPDGRSGSINTPSDHEVFAVNRALTDAVLVGAQTVRAEGYRAIDLSEDQQALRVREGLAAFPTLAVVSGRLDLDPAFATPDPAHGPVVIITVKARTDAEIAPFLDAGVDVARVAGDRATAADVLGALHTRGLRRILCEGGPHLHRDLLAAGLVDELCLTLAPVAVAGDGIRSTSGDALDPTPAFALHHLLHADDETVITSYRRAD